MIPARSPAIRRPNRPSRNTVAVPSSAVRMRCDSTLSIPSLAGMARNTVYSGRVHRGLEHAVRGRADRRVEAERVDEAPAVGEQPGLLVVEGLVGQHEARRARVGHGDDVEDAPHSGGGGDQPEAGQESPRATHAPNASQGPVPDRCTSLRPRAVPRDRAGWCPTLVGRYPSVDRPRGRPFWLARSTTHRGVSRAVTRTLPRPGSRCSGHAVRACASRRAPLRVPARARRHPCLRSGGRALLPRRSVVGGGRLPRRRHLLRARAGSSSRRCW